MPETSSTADPRFPVGKFAMPADISAAHRMHATTTLDQMPAKLREAVSGLSEAQLDTPYRDGGWSVRQVVHHVGDSHATAFHRIRKALTEDWPEVHGYDEKAFAELPDRSAPVAWSLAMIEGVHAPWVMMLRSLTDDQWQRGFRHSERGKQTIEQATLLYEWHALHHVAHITELRKRLRW